MSPALTMSILKEISSVAFPVGFHERDLRFFAASVVEHFGHLRKMLALLAAQLFGRGALAAR